MKTKILTFLFAFFPGAGQMYQGYMKRGLSLITLFCLCFLLGMLINPLFVTMIIVWMYSFFDTFNLRKQLEENAAPLDDYVIQLDLHDKRLEQLMSESHKLLGWLLIVFGALVAYENIIMKLLDDLLERWGQNSIFRACYLVLSELPQIVVCVILIVCGVWLVNGGRTPNGKTKSAEDKNPLKMLLDYINERKNNKSDDTEDDIASDAPSKVASYSDEEDDSEFSNTFDGQ